MPLEPKESICKLDKYNELNRVWEKEDENSVSQSLEDVKSDRSLMDTEDRLQEESSNLPVLEKKIDFNTVSNFNAIKEVSPYEEDTSNITRSQMMMPSYSTKFKEFEGFELRRSYTTNVGGDGSKSKSSKEKTPGQDKSRSVKMQEIAENKESLSSEVESLQSESVDLQYDEKTVELKVADSIHILS